jgi:CxxC motif-containing protein (DUF1111 family)
MLKQTFTFVNIFGVSSRPAPWIGPAVFAAVLGAACDAGDDDPGLVPEPGEELSGGDTTVFDTTRDAFARAARNMSQERRGEFALGDHQFNRGWVTAPASAEGTDGLGPLYNATSCSTCHFKDGRGAPPEPGEPFKALFFRLSIEGTDERGGPLPDPAYGDQLSPFAILGVAAEGAPRVDYEIVPGTYGDGEPFELRRPIYSVESLAYGPLAGDAVLAPRIARQLVGLGLLAAVDEATILALADPDDADGDGISGRSNHVWDERAGGHRLGRFGWKAAQPTIEQQSAAAFLGDMGITTDLYPEQGCTSMQSACASAPTGGAPELDASKLERITFYMHTLAVPARRDVGDADVLAGRELFRSAGCSGCHVMKLTTGELSGYPELSDQTIRPMTDLLLHDMGPDLADGRSEFDAGGGEWRTPPLWGVGLVETVNRHTFFLHDGRARGFAEAILWHGGEAFGAREAFRTMDAADRARLIKFLESL